MTQNSRYSVSRGYVHWRKSAYAADDLLDVGQLHQAQLNELPRSKFTQASLKELEDYYNRFAPPNPVKLGYTGQSNLINYKNLNYGNPVKDGIKDILQKFEKRNTNGNVSLGVAGHAGKEIKHITAASIKQLISEYSSALNYLNQIKNQREGLQLSVNQFRQLRKYIDKLKKNKGKLKQLLRDMAQSRAMPLEQLNQHWLQAKGNDDILQLFGDLEQLQSLYIQPTSKQIGDMQEEVAASLKRQSEATIENGKVEIFRAARVGNVGAHTNMIMLQNNSFINQSIVNQTLGTKNFVDKSSSAKIRTQESQQTIDIVVEFANRDDFGIRTLKGSVKAYANLSNIHIVSGAPLSTILEISSNPNFLTHYMNIMSIPIGGHVDGEDYSLTNLRKDTKSYVKRLGLLRALLGARGRNFSNTANVFMVANRGKWKFYDIMELVKNKNALKALSGAEGISTIEMPWEYSSGIGVQQAAINRISKLYAKIHSIKLYLSLDLTKI